MHARPLYAPADANASAHVHAASNAIDVCPASAASTTRTASRQPLPLQPTLRYPGQATHSPPRRRRVSRRRDQKATRDCRHRGQRASPVAVLLYFASHIVHVRLRARHGALGLGHRRPSRQED